MTNLRVGVGDFVPLELTVKRLVHAAKDHLKASRSNTDMSAECSQ